MSQGELQSRPKLECICGDEHGELERSSRHIILGLIWVLILKVRLDPNFVDHQEGGGKGADSRPLKVGQHSVLP